MIVRILGEGQYELADSSLADLEARDQELLAAIEGGDEGRFSAVLSSLLERVRTDGAKLDVERIVPSELTVPHEGSSLEEVRELLASEPVEADETISGGT